MLTGDLVRVRRKDGAIVPRWLRGPAAARAVPIAAEMIEAMAAMVGRSRDEIDDALEAVEIPAQDRIVGLGLRKLLDDRAEYAIAAGVDPEALRHEVFHAAAAAHRALALKDRFDRGAVLAAAAARLGTSPEAIEAGLYADLRGNEILVRAPAMRAEHLVDRYNLALAQAVLLRAERVEVRITGETAARYREVFRAARFHGLLHVVGGDPAKGYVILLDGPFSLFDSVQRYGIKLALFLPSVLACRTWSLRADVRWGKRKERLVFELGPRDGLAPVPHDDARLSPELEAFCEGFRRLGSRWSVAPCDRVFALPGEVACIPDLVFSNADTGEDVFLEVFGFWSRAAVWHRVELVKRGFPGRILLAAGKQLRVSEEVLGDDDAGELYVYRATMSPRAVLARLEKERR